MDWNGLEDKIEGIVTHYDSLKEDSMDMKEFKRIQKEELEAVMQVISEHVDYAA